MIEADKLQKYYGERLAVRNATFTVGKSEIVGLLGPNGAGKTTTMRMLTSYLPADGGRAVVAGYDVAEKPMEVRKRLGYLPETVPLYTEMPVNLYLDFMAKLRGVPGKGRKKRVEEVMEMCRIADVSHKIIGKLSRGYRQRVGLAQAIVHNPEVIILDEPTVGLDPRQIIEIRKVIKDLAQNHSVILSTHILPEVSAICDRVVVINRGRVLVEDTLANLEQRNSATERLRLEVRAPYDALTEFLDDFEGIEDYDLAEPDPEQEGHDSHQVELFTVRDAAIRERLAAAIIGKGWGLLELKVDNYTLEEVFVQLINSDTEQFEDEEVAVAPMPGTLDEEIEAPVQQTRDYDDEMDEPESDPEAEKEIVAADGAKVRKAAPSFLQSQDDAQAETKEGKTEK
jgi:ABC-2 type transport system ATP-binding protein